ncbi:MAG: efflux RND transporter periplasmic adaptor subunit [Steroidobacteraceae bacterium]
MKAVLLLIPALLLAGCSEPAATPTQPTPVRVAVAAEGPATPPLQASGLVVPRDELRLAFKVGGIVRRIAVRAGETVKEGQVLAELDLTEVDAQVEQARQLAIKAERDLKRGEALHADQVIPLEQLENLRTQAGIAAAQRRSAEYNGRHARLVAPRDARVLRRLAEPNDLVPAGQVVLMLGTDGSGLAVRAGLADRDVPRVRIGDRVDVRLDPWPDQTFAATVTEVAGAASERTGLFEVEAGLTEAAPDLRAGMVARLRFVPASGDALVHVPLGAILEGDGGHATVYVLDGETVRKRVVDVAWIGADSVALRSGLAAGERVVSSGAPYLHDGEAVRIRP